MGKIMLDGYGRAYCDIFIKSQFSQAMERVTFKVDTGADFTTISKGLLKRLGYDDAWINKNKKSVSGSATSVASGDSVDTYFVQLPVINIYGYEAKNWPFAIILDGIDENGNKVNKDYRPLFGLDLLTGFKFILDNENDCFELHRLKMFKQRQIRFPDQEIHAINRHTAQKAVLLKPV